jgi:[ribosomal protein S5]-alanine N-acetyltransferase
MAKRMAEWVFRTERVGVRPKRPEDATALHRVFGDSEVMRYLGGPMQSLALTQAFVAQHIAHQEEHGFSMWALIEGASDELIGDVGYLAHEDGVEIGWHLRRASWGRGYATEAARACVDHGMTVFGFDTISAFVETANTRSIRVIERLGMELVRSEAGDGVPPWREYAVSTQRDRHPA